MFCESYRESLGHAAIAGEALTRPQEEHLQSCPACRVALAEERALMRAIDSGLSSLANAEAPASLPASVRTRIEAASAPTNRWLFPSLACASAALGISFVLFYAQPKPGGSEKIAVAQAGPAIAAPAFDPAPLTVASGASSSARLGPGIPQSRKPHASSPAFESQVLVSQEEQLHFQKYLASLRAPRILSGEKVMANSDRDGEIAKLEIAELEFGQLSIEPLSSGDSQ